MITQLESERIKKLVNQDKIFTFHLLITTLNCSIRTGRRKLVSLQAITSYNFSGKYYTLPDIPKFDKNGLWKYKNVMFSKYGNLKNTVTHLVTTSLSGIKYGDLCQLLCISAESLRTYLKSFEEIRQDKYGRYTILYSKDMQLYQKQKNYRKIYLSEEENMMQLDIKEVLILVDRIKYPKSTLEQCAQRLQHQGYKISVTMIYQLLVHHDLLKKTVVMK
ncbi:MAG: hypothetical protein GY870_22270 [archaeon]|nr:hypothetical protein [archaeon]